MTIKTFLQNLIFYKHNICDVVHPPAHIQWSSNLLNCSESLSGSCDAIFFYILWSVTNQSLFAISD